MWLPEDKRTDRGEENLPLGHIVGLVKGLTRYFRYLRGLLHVLLSRTNISSFSVDRLVCPLFQQLLQSLVDLLLPRELLFDHLKYKILTC